MMIPELPANEVDRLKVVRQYEPYMVEKRRDHHEIARKVAEAFDVPMAFITLIDVNQQRFIACYGVHLPPIGRHFSLCAHAMLKEDMTVVPNARTDPRFMCNPLVQGEPNIRFYASMPLRTEEGFVVGSLVIADAQPRVLGRGHLDLLAAFSTMIMDDLGDRVAQSNVPANEAEAL